MAASITTSTRFTFVFLEYHPIFQIISRIAWTTDATPRVHKSIGIEHPPVVGSDKAAELAILQEIYASSDGFRDVSNVSVMPSVGGFDSTSEAAELESFAVPNPLISGYLTRGITKKKIDGVLLEDGSVGRDSTTGQPTLGFEGIVETKARKRAGTNFDAPLRNWEVTFTSESYIRLLLEIPSTNSINLDDLDNYTDVRAMIAWLESKRTSGDAVGSDASDPDTILGGSRRYTFIQESGGSEIVVRHFIGYVQTNSDNNVYSYIIDLLRVAGAPIDNDQLVALLETETISLTNTDTDKEDAEIGGPDTIVKGKIFDLGDIKIRATLSGVYIEKLDLNGNKVITPILRPATVNINTLPDLTGSTTTKRIPSVWDFDTVHHDNNSTKSIVVIPNPYQLITHQGTHRLIAFHNLKNTPLIVKDWNLNSLVELDQGERAEFQITLEGRNSGGSLISLHIPPRKAQIVWSTISPDSSNRNFDGLNIGVWNERSSDNGIRFRTLPYVAANRATDHGASFILPTGASPVGGQSVAIDSVTDFDWDKAIKIAHKGSLRIRSRIELKWHADTSGGVTGLNGIRLLRIPVDGSDPHGIGDYLTNSFTGAGTVNTHYANADTEVEAGDIVIPFFIYYGNNLTAMDDHLLLKRIDIRGILEPHVAVPWIVS